MLDSGHHRLAARPLQGNQFAVNHERVVTPPPLAVVFSQEVYPHDNVWFDIRHGVGVLEPEVGDPVRPHRATISNPQCRPSWLQSGFVGAGKILADRRLTPDPVSRSTRTVLLASLLVA